MSNLLEKSRTLNRLIQKAPGSPVECAEMAKVLGELVDANVYITGRNGRMLGYSMKDAYDCPQFASRFAGNASIAENFNAYLRGLNQTVLNIPGDDIPCPLGDAELGCAFGGRTTAVVPIIVNDQRQGTIVLTKFDDKEFDYEDTILAESGAIVIGMEILRERSARIDEENRQKSAARIAIGTLSYSEQEAIEHIFAELDGKEALLVASRIADRVGITRSVIVNALRKLESAGVVETKSLGMKGTYIRVLNDSLKEEMEKGNICKYCKRIGIVR